MCVYISAGMIVYTHNISSIGLNIFISVAKDWRGTKSYITLSELVLLQMYVVFSHWFTTQITLPIGLLYTNLLFYPRGITTTTMMYNHKTTMMYNHKTTPPMVSYVAIFLMTISGHGVEKMEDFLLEFPTPL